MALRVAVQMDPMDGININGDSSFALMLSAQARGYDVWHYDVGTLSLDANDRLTAFAHPVLYRRIEAARAAGQRINFLQKWPALPRLCHGFGRND